MKTAILLATCKADKLEAKVLRHDSYSEVLAEYKSRVAEGRGEPGYDSLEIWTGPPSKRHSRFKDSSVAPAAATAIPTPEEGLDPASGEGGGTEDATTEDATTEDATTEDATTEDATTEDAPEPPAELPGLTPKSSRGGRKG